MSTQTQTQTQTEDDSLGVATECDSPMVVVVGVVTEECEDGEEENDDDDNASSSDSDDDSNEYTSLLSSDHKSASEILRKWVRTQVLNTRGYSDYANNIDDDENKAELENIWGSYEIEIWDDFRVMEHQFFKNARKTFVSMGFQKRIEEINKTQEARKKLKTTQQ